MTALLMVEQRANGTGDGAPFILDRHGAKTQGHDDDRRTRELREGLMRHEGVNSIEADTSDEDVERIVGALHEPHYLEALRNVTSEEPRMMPEWAPPGLPADSPVWAGVVTTAFEGARTAITAAQRIVGGATFTYALSRPPGHHAGPSWLGGYCYLNTAAIAAYALCEGGVTPVSILDVDFHFPTGTSAIVAPLESISLASLHASTLAEVPWRSVEPRDRECFVEFAQTPDLDTYLQTLSEVVHEHTRKSSAIVLSLGYDTVHTDPHGSWDFPPSAFAEVGRILASSGLPICVIQEGGYSLEALAECSHAFATGLLAPSRVLHHGVATPTAHSVRGAHASAQGGPR
jgi:acetoin utilization deacetylase AcuC-like enzyme